MRHFDAWILRDPYSIFHYYSTGHRWKETVRDLIQERKICAPPSLSLDNADGNASPSPEPVNPYARPMNTQSTSPFMSKLPLEIRLMIYEYAFGDQVVHLVQVKDKIRHVRCKNTTSSLDKHRRCCPVTAARWRNVHDSTTPDSTTSNTASTSNMLYPHTNPSLPSNLTSSPVSLLTTCRTIYAEASTILYTNSSFDVDDLTTFIAFSLSISPPSLAFIKRLSIQWTPVWQPMAGEEHKSSIYSHTHNDRLWAAFWNRVAALEGLEDLTLSVDLGRFVGTSVLGPAPGPGAAAGEAGAGLIGNNRLPLSINSPWTAPLLSVRGLRSFELGITARCDAYTKSVLEGDLVRDAVILRDHLRAVMCSERGAAFPELPGMSGKDLLMRVELLRRCAFESGSGEECESGRGRGGLRPRLAITAA
ncbi:hypothetical protein BDW59DRAFT_139541 [Aspergillus cavernicola]|uniref:DUF7730 domain-containing protein n=1 Tax=Aspergillus cavernicola TaxID=176166 RepID=A0ABR4IW83_9EURO